MTASTVDRIAQAVATLVQRFGVPAYLYSAEIADVAHMRTSTVTRHGRRGVQLVSAAGWQARYIGGSRWRVQRGEP